MKRERLNALLARAQPLLPYLKNRYIFTTLIFGLWMLFFDQYNVRSQAQVGSRLGRLQKEQQWYATEIARMQDEKNRLLHNPMELERVARERYLMKREDEDLFVVVEKKNE